MIKLKKNMIIALLVLSIVFLIISVIGLIIAICFTISQLRVYPQPLDSFWSLELSIILIVICVLLLILSIIGIIFSIFKLKG